MIEVAKNIKVGDVVYAWFLPPWEKSKDKKPAETEYRLGELRADWLKLSAMDGGYSIIFNKELIETWNGSVRRAK